MKTNVEKAILKTLVFSEPNIYGSVSVTSRLYTLYIQYNLEYYIVDGNVSISNNRFRTLEEAKEAVRQDYLTRYKELLDLKYED